MLRRKLSFGRRPFLWGGLVAGLALAARCLQLRRSAQHQTGPMPALLSDPFLLHPTADSVRVVWFVESPAREHWLEYGPQLQRRAEASSLLLGRTQEDQLSYVGSQSRDGSTFDRPTARPVWRQEATATELPAGRQRWPYRVCTRFDDGSVACSDRFTLAASPSPGTALQILLTSDHQLMPMVAANLQGVAATVDRPDAVFFAGDLVNVPDRASEWFDDNRGGAFFPCLQGRARYAMADGATTYKGAPLIQHAPLFVAVGNHEVMGRANPNRDLNAQFNDPIPRRVAADRWQEAGVEGDREAWITNHSFNFDTVREIFQLDRRGYYATTYGDVRLIVLFATNIWRPPGLTPKRPGRYAEAAADLDAPERWGYGQHIFAPIGPGSEQYAWLQAELTSDAYRRAKYKIAMFHHPPHTLGGNIVPAYTDPVREIDRDAAGTVTAVRYTYPRDRDWLARHVVPLLEAAGIQLVFYGHSHLWNRFQSPAGTHFLETSNVGNTYGAAWQPEPPRPIAPEEQAVAYGDPNGLKPIVPNLAPLQDESGQALPYLASNEVSAFSLLDTATGSVTSYRLDTRTPEAAPVAFDRFTIG